MLNYIVLFLFLIVIGFLSYYSIYLWFNAGGSSLYQRISFTGMLGLLTTLVIFSAYLNAMFNLFNISIDLLFITYILKVLFTYNLFKVWQIRHIQLSKQNYGLVMLILSILNISLLFIDKYELLVIFNQQLTKVIPIILNTLLLIIVNILYFRFNKFSAGSDFKFFPIIIFSLILVNLGFVLMEINLLSQVIYDFFQVLESISYLAMMKICINDFKRSMYY